MAYLLQQGQTEPISLANASVGGFLAGVLGAFVSGSSLCQSNC